MNHQVFQVGSPNPQVFQGGLYKPPSYPKKVFTKPQVFQEKTKAKDTARKCSKKKGPHVKKITYFPQNSGVLKKKRSSCRKIANFLQNLRCSPKKGLYKFFARSLVCSKTKKTITWKPQTPQKHKFYHALIIYH